MALFHYRAHLGIAKDIKDTTAEACALLNLGMDLLIILEFQNKFQHFQEIA